MKKFMYISFFLVCLGCQHYAEIELNQILFHPNSDICMSAMLSKGGEREWGIDVDVIRFHKDDTIIRIQFDTDTTFSRYEWYIPVSDDISDSLFLDEICKDYNVISDPKNNTIHCIENELSFYYYLGPVDDFINLEPNRYLVVVYDPILDECSSVDSMLYRM